jgi:hypothetical protein
MTARRFHARSASDLRLAAAQLTSAAEAIDAKGPDSLPAALLLKDAEAAISRATAPSLPADDKYAAWGRHLRDGGAL